MANQGEVSIVFRGKKIKSLNNQNSNISPQIRSQSNDQNVKNPKDILTRKATNLLQNMDLERIPESQKSSKKKKEYLPDCVLSQSQIAVDIESNKSHSSNSASISCSSANLEESKSYDNDDQK